MARQHEADVHRIPGVSRLLLDHGVRQGQEEGDYQYSRVDLELALHRVYPELPEELLLCVIARRES